MTQLRKAVLTGCLRRTVANTLSIGFDAQMVPVLGGEVEEGEQRSPILGQTGDRLVYLSANTSIAASAAARVGAP
jgi:hypothetical protein